MVSRLGYDIAIVGGGAAGCVLAARLAAAGKQTVILLEAGPDSRARVPDEMRDGWRLGRLHDWGYDRSQMTTATVGKVRRGRLLGGTSWMTRFAVRGSPADFDEWAALGNPGWTFARGAAVLQAPRDRCRIRRPAVARRPRTDPGQPLSRARADRRSMRRPRPSPVGRVSRGSRITTSRRGGRRADADELSSAIGSPPTPTSGRYRRHELAVARLAGRRVLIDGGRATGVRLVDGRRRGPRMVVTARRDIRQSADPDAFGHRSGGGPSGARRRRPRGPAGRRRQPRRPSRRRRRHRLRGPRRATVRSSTRSRHSTAHAAIGGGPGPDVLGERPGRATTRPGSNSTRSSSGRCPVVGAPAVGGSGRSATDRAAGRVGAADVERLIEGFGSAWRSPIDPCSGARRSPPRRAWRRRRVARVVRENAYSIPHVVGTCAMGPTRERRRHRRRGRVHGVDGLFVVDASIIPEPPSGFPTSRR